MPDFYSQPLEPIQEGCPDIEAADSGAPQAATQPIISEWMEVHRITGQRTKQQVKAGIRMPAPRRVRRRGKGVTYVEEEEDNPEAGQAVQPQDSGCLRGLGAQPRATSGLAGLRGLGARPGATSGMAGLRGLGAFGGLGGLGDPVRGRTKRSFRERCSSSKEGGSTEETIPAVFASQDSTGTSALPGGSFLREPD